MIRLMPRDLAVYPPVVLAGYALAAGSVHTLTAAEPRMWFWTAVGVSAAVAWWVPLVFAPGAFLLLILAARLPGRWPRASRRAVLLAVAPLLFAGTMGAAAVAATGDAAILTWPYLTTVVAPALAYAAIVRLPK
jgi:hypothetical protein